MHIYPITLLLLALMVIIPDLYIYQRFMRNRTNRSTAILHGILSTYFIVVSLAIMLNMNRIYNPETSYRLLRFLTILGCVYIPKLIFCNFDLIFFLTKKRWRKIQYAGYIVAGLTFFTMLHGVVYERFNFKKGVYNIELEDLPPAFEGYKIVQFSDMHLGSFTYSQERLKPLMDSINAQHPDLIVFTGDMVNNFASECNQWAEVFDRLNDSIPKLAILGNHDYSVYFDWENEDLKSMNKIALRQKIRDFGFKLLLNKPETIYRGNDSIVMIGLENWGRRPETRHADLEKALQGTEGFATKILLSHDPTYWKDSICDRTDIDLTLSGHTHAAQLGISIGSFKVSPAKLLFDYWDGLYIEDGKYILVSRGIGCVGIPARLGMSPEYSLITLTKKKQ
ncbi:MAG: metallophosphoesterase [Paludibacteraceae bacterium]|nr:metallophosphoesterase [Paludibacteraceae bacterium]